MKLVEAPQEDDALHEDIRYMNCGARKLPSVHKPRPGKTANQFIPGPFGTIFCQDRLGAISLAGEIETVHRLAEMRFRASTRSENLLP